MNTPREPLLEHPRYEPGPVLGRGGQGVVLRVRDREAPERPLVAKLWLSGTFEPAVLSAEFALLRRLDIRGLVRAHDLGRDQRTGAPFLVEDFVEGDTAHAFIAAAPERRVARLAYVICEVAATLASLHDAAFVHGDLKPEHVRVTADERVLVLDLGSALARSPVNGAQVPIALTPAFAAPEVRGGARPTRASDLYSLGALAWALAVGSPPSVRPPKLRRVAEWVPPSLADLIDRLLELHPRDRPEDAERVLERLGHTDLPPARRAVPPPIGRASQLASLLEPRAGVRYLLGPSGSGKTHLLREVLTRALLSRRLARRVSFPHADLAFVAQLVSFFRGTDAAWPFTVRGTAANPMLVTLDALHEAPVELIAALDAYRCRASSLELDLLVAAREAPPGAQVVLLETLDSAAFSELCQLLGVNDPAQIAEYSRMTGRNPGWLVAARGRVPLSHDMVLDRASSLSAGASQLLAELSVLGGVASERWLRSLSSSPERALLAELAELLSAALIVRRGDGEQLAYALQDLELAPKIAAALGSFEIVERVSALIIEDDAAPARALLSLANAPFLPNQREGLLARAALLARRAGARSDEADALFALAASKSQRTRERLLRLERLTRHSGGNHPQVLSWLVDAAEQDPVLVPLAFRRQAEQAARAGDFTLAEAQITRAELAAHSLADRPGAALSLATRGAIALYRADVVGAEQALRGALAEIATLDIDDAEEIARIEHNSGVVALYGDRIADAARAFERSLAIKRQLGDRAGVRSCLLNLGLALARSADYARAVSVLEEALLLAVSLAQHAGRAWCLAARADLEIRRGDARAADRYICEAEAVLQAPPMVRADLVLLKGQSALLDGDAARALAALSELDRELCRSDPLLDTRALLIWAGAQLATLPAAPRAAARAAIRAARAARQARLFEIEAQALALLRRARKPLSSVRQPRYAESMPDRDAPLWSWLNDAASGTPRAEAIIRLLRQLRESSGAERALLATSDQHGHPVQGWAVDLDGFALDSACSRFDLELLQRCADARVTLYQRDVETVGGRGSRLAIAAPASGCELRSVLLLEHRFRVAAFDGLSSQETARFAILAGLATRLGPVGPVEVFDHALEGPSSKLLESQPATHVTGETTALPESGPRRDFASIIGKSRALRAVLAKLETAVESDLPVLILGETGTGKELFARALHEHGTRARAPFVALNCAAVPDSLFESELFGHARGAFTGAERARPGLIARAEGGVLFLDELAELPLARQAALLRVLESRQYRPVGSDEERPFDVRIVSASNRPLDAEVARGKFRQDLLFRINVLELGVPALRQRPEDIPVLVRAFLDRSKTRVVVSPDAMSALESYAWPGNVRELEHQIQRLLALGVARIEHAHLPRGLRGSRSAGPRRTRTEAAPRAVVPLDVRAEVERALSQAEGNITHAAQALGLTRHGLKKRMLRLGLRAPQKLGDSR
ncbi:MAG TPA: sigma 54-interacting transcriptional regulator [Polyangiaceae bacterium]|nr:sigma 54-interacting transcriptional regulator [Polyangiaceae bacterium]